MEEAAAVPIEITEEIICRLPVEALHRFRCVSPLFNKLVSEYRLARKHLSYAIKHIDNTHLLSLARRRSSGEEYLHLVVRACPLSCIPGRALQNSRDVVELPPLLFQQDNANNITTITKIHDGLVCFGNRHRPIFLYDLISGTFTRVPELTFGPNYFRVDTLIGYHQSYDDYAIIRFSSDEPFTTVWVYLLNGMRWEFSIEMPYTFAYGGCVFVNGRFYWTAKAGGRSFYIASVNAVFFDLWLVRVPEYVGRGDSVHCLKLINVQEKLYAYNNYNYQNEEEEEESCCSIWEAPTPIFDNNRSWTKVLSIPLKLIRGCSEFRILYLYESGVVLMMTTSSERGIKELWWMFGEGTVLYKQAIDDDDDGDGTSLVVDGIVHQGPIN